MLLIGIIHRHCLSSHPLGAFLQLPHVHSRVIALTVLLSIAAHAQSAGRTAANSGDRADYIVVAPERYLSYAERLAEYRHQHDNLAAIVVPFESILADFGTATSPDTALRAFIQSTLHASQDHGSTYFVLLGNVDAIPSHMEAEDLVPLDVAGYDSLAVDQWFVEDPSSPVGSVNVQAMLGRFPAWDSTSLSVMINKQIAYDSGDYGPWTRTCIGLADYDTLTFGIFESGMKGLLGILSRAWDDTVSVHIELQSPQHIDSVAFKELWSEGASIFAYSGHANPYVLSATHYFTTASVDSLNNGDRLPVCFFGSCNLRFDERDPSPISTHLLEKRGGGAVACVVSTGDNYFSSITGFYETLFTTLAENPSGSVGEAFVTAKNAHPEFILRRMSFLGDPALRIKHNIVSTIGPVPHDRPAGFLLEQNFPNPFNPKTVISGQWTVNSVVRLAVYDNLGRKVAVLADGHYPAGKYTFTFDGTHLSSGVYLYRLTVGSSTAVRKMTLIK